MTDQKQLWDQGAFSADYRLKCFDLALTDPRALLDSFLVLDFETQETDVFPLLRGLFAELTAGYPSKYSQAFSDDIRTPQQLQRFLQRLLSFWGKVGQQGDVCDVAHQLLRFKPNDTQLISLLANAKIKLNQPQAAKRYLEQLCDQTNGHAPTLAALKKLARVYEQLGFNADAERRYLQLAQMERYPERHLRRYWRSITSRMLEPEIDERFFGLFSIRRYKSFAAIMLVEHKLQIGDVSDPSYITAYKHLQHCYRWNKSNCGLQIAYARAFLGANPKEKNKALAIFEKIKKRFPQEFSIIVRHLVQLHNQLNQPDRAAQLIEKALQENPKSEALWQLKIKQSPADLDDVFLDKLEAAYDPDDPKEARICARILSLAGDKDRAVQKVAPHIRADTFDKNCFEVFCTIALAAGEVWRLRPYKGRLRSLQRSAGELDNTQMQLANLMSLYPNGEIWEESFQFPQDMVPLILSSAPTPYEASPEAAVMVVTAGLGSGGAERQTVATVCHLDNKVMGGRKVELVCQNLNPLLNRDFYLKQIQQGGHKYIDLKRAGPEIRKRGRISTTPLQKQHMSLLETLPADVSAFAQDLYLLFCEERPALVHAWQDTTSIAAALAAKLAGVPSILLSGRSMRPVMKKRFRHYLKQAYVLLLQEPNVKMINNSAAGARDYEEWLAIKPNTIEVVYNGLDLGIFRSGNEAEDVAMVRKKLRIPSNAEILGGVMRMTEEKRPEWFVKTAISLCEMRTSLHVIMLGDGPMRPELQGLLDASTVAGRIHLVGNQSPVTPWMRAMDCLMLTSRIEGLPNVLIEAQSLGTPVAAANVGGVMEAVLPDKTALVLPAVDAEAWPGLLDEFLDKISASDSYQKAAYAYAEETFSMGAMAANTERVYCSFSSQKNEV